MSQPQHIYASRLTRRNRAWGRRRRRRRSLAWLATALLTLVVVAAAAGTALGYALA
jgi:hypothetical protein